MKPTTLLVALAWLVCSGCAHVLLSEEEGARLRDSAWKIESQPAPAPVKEPKAAP